MNRMPGEVSVCLPDVYPVADRLTGCRETNYNHFFRLKKNSMTMAIIIMIAHKM